MNPLLILACVVQTVEGGDIDDVRCKTAFVQELIEVIGDEAREHHVSPGLIAATIYAESHFKTNARSQREAHGLMQVKKGGAASGPYRKLSVAQLRDVRTNIHVGVAYMAVLQPLCPWASQWLTKYNRGPGAARGCRSSAYGRGVVAALNLGRRQHLRRFAGTGTDVLGPVRTEASGWSPLGWEGPAKWSGARSVQSAEALAEPFAEP